MTESELLNEALVRLDELFRGLAADVKAINKSLWWFSGHNETAVFPMHAYLSFSRDGTPGEEDVILSAGLSRKEKLLTWAADISEGDGLVLADGPSGQFSEGADLRAWLSSQVSNSITFFSNHRELLLTLLT